MRLLFMMIFYVKYHGITFYYLIFFYLYESNYIVFLL